MILVIEDVYKRQVYRAAATAQAGHKQGVNSNGTAALRPSA